MISPSEHRIHRVAYLGEQDGDVERDLKRLLSEYFERENCCDSAYLCQVMYQRNSSEGSDLRRHVALCIRTHEDSDECKNALSVDVGRIFLDLGFAADQYLDILFPSESDEVSVRKVARPFWESKSMRQNDTLVVTSRKI